MKKYFLIVGIGILGACAQPHDVHPIREFSSPQDGPSVVNGKMVNLDKDSRARTIVYLESKHADKSLANCTGTVIAPSAILTAGHCLENAKSVKVRFAGAPEKTAAIRDWKIHPNYRKPEKLEVGKVTPDLALIRLKSPVPSGVRSAQMATKDNKLELGQSVISYGYGFSDAGTADFLGIFEWEYKESNRLLNAGRFTVVAAKDAGTKFKKTKLGLDGSVFITYAEKSSICQGDSGGPTFLTNTEIPTIAGVNSFITDGRCINAANGIADLRFNRAWIDETLEKWFPLPTKVESTPSQGPGNNPSQP